jgi:hypothetical protein
MANELALDLSQDVPNQLTAIADRERSKLLPKNEYVQTGDEYSATNPNAIADGDSKGRGTGVFLDVYNNQSGTREDISERISGIRINKYNSSNVYPNFQL